MCRQPPHAALPATLLLLGQRPTHEGKDTSPQVSKAGYIASSTRPQALPAGQKRDPGEDPEPDGLNSFSAEPQLLTESLVVVTSFVRPNKSLNFDNVIYLRNKEEEILLVIPPPKI